MMTRSAVGCSAAEGQQGKEQRAKRASLGSSCSGRDGVRGGRFGVPSVQASVLAAGGMIVSKATSRAVRSRLRLLAGADRDGSADGDPAPMLTVRGCSLRASPSDPLEWESVWMC